MTNAPYRAATARERCPSFCTCCETTAPLKIQPLLRNRSRKCFVLSVRFLRSGARDFHQPLWPAGQWGTPLKVALEDVRRPLPRGRGSVTDSKIRETFVAFGGRHPAMGTPLRSWPCNSLQSPRVQIDHRLSSDLFAGAGPHSSRINNWTPLGSSAGGGDDGGRLPKVRWIRGIANAISVR